MQDLIGRGTQYCTYVTQTLTEITSIKFSTIWMLN